MEGAGCGKPVVVVEHLEEGLSPWILLEYRHLSSIYGSQCVVFTNMPLRYHRIMARYGKPVVESIVDMVDRGLVRREDVIVLDPASPRELTYRDLSSARYVVVGGILGDHPPRRRTWELLTSRLTGARAFNIGSGQYSIDGAVYYIHYMYLNKGVDGYRYVDGVSIETPEGVVRLPFRYPLVDGKPLISGDLVYYIVNKRLPDHVWSEVKG
ncbi:RNA methyltransferase [Desulfurococcus mucosus]|uniref:RNA methyltransferase n=1 Tax=Desulfurococcus mucosus TaxID=2275 RepID=UPI00064F0598|nr:RNA methyltransferase [Desulfurococcus mucosus]